MLLAMIFLSIIAVACFAGAVIYGAVRPRVDWADIAGNRVSWDVRADDVFIEEADLKVGKTRIPLEAFANHPEFKNYIYARLKEILIQRASTAEVMNGRVANISNLKRKGMWRFYVLIALCCLSIIILRLDVGHGNGIVGGLSVNQKLVTGLMLNCILFLLIPVQLYLFNSWSVSRDALYLGKWPFVKDIPWKNISLITISLPLSLSRSIVATYLFELKLDTGPKVIKFTDTKLGKLLKIYDAILLHRPDLKISGDAI